MRGSVRGCVRACVGACIDLFLLSILCLPLSHSFSKCISVERSGYLHLSVHVRLFYLFMFFVIQNNSLFHGNVYDRRNQV